MNIKIRVEIDRTEWRGRAILYYEDGSHMLKVGMDRNANASGGWAAIDINFLKWSTPKGEPISNDRRAEIFNQINEWSKNNNTSIVVTKGTTKEEHQARLISKGWTIEELPDGGWKAIPPKKG